MINPCAVPFEPAAKMGATLSSIFGSFLRLVADSTGCRSRSIQDTHPTRRQAWPDVDFFSSISQIAVLIINQSQGGGLFWRRGYFGVT
eukprot:SAG11_NODE_23788_length_383_cov_0.644366_2_plen_87_part_01